MSTLADDTSALKRAKHHLRRSMHRLIRANVFGEKPPQPKAQKPLIPTHSNNVFHDQALLQLASVYESLQLGDSHEATSMVYATGVRIFGAEAFERALQGRLSRTGSPGRW